jgi:predicted lipase
MNLQPATCNLQLARACVAAAARVYSEVSFQSELAHVLIVPATTETPMIIAFRGSADTKDWLTDFKMRFGETPYGWVHAGFWASANSVMEQILGLAQVRAAIPVVITGHSKGAAEALICARLLAASGKPVEAVVTFGGPRVGNKKWRADYGKALGDRTTRWVHEEDIVCRMAAWCTGYRHVPAVEAFIASFGGLKINPPLWCKAASDIWGTFWGYESGQIKQVQDHPVTQYLQHLAKL